MMRIGIIAFGSRGDVQPYVALGKGLKQASYEVVLLTHDPYWFVVRDWSSSRLVATLVPLSIK